MQDNPDTSPMRQIAIILFATALLALLGAAHHPHGGHAHSVAEAARMMADAAGPVRLVHGFLLLILLVQLAALAGFSRLLGARGVFGHFALLAQLLGSGLGMIAGAINGFAMPSFIAAYAGETVAGAGADGFVAVQRFAWALNQALSDMMAVGWALAAIAWSVLLFGRGGWARALAALGFASGLVIAGGLVSGLLRLDVAGFQLAMALYETWVAALAIWLLVEARAGRTLAPTLS